MRLNKPKTKNMWLLDARDNNTDMSKLTHKDMSFVPSFRNPLNKLSLAYIRAKNKTQYVYHLGFSARQLTVKPANEITKELYIRSITDKTDMFKNLHKDINKNNNNFSRISYSHDLIHSTLADYRGNVYTNVDNLSIDNSEDNSNYFIPLLTQLDPLYHTMSPSREKIIKYFLDNYSSYSHAELTSLGYEALYTFISKNPIEYDGNKIYGVVHDEDNNFNSEYLKKTLYLDGKPPNVIPKFKTDYIQFDIVFYKENGDELKRVTHTTENTLICYYLASVSKTRDAFFESSSQFSQFRDALSPITLKVNGQIIPHVEKYYTWKEEEDIKMYEDKISEEKDPSKVREYEKKIEYIEIQAQHRNSTRVASYWRWMDVTAYNVDDLRYLGERTISALKHKNYDLYEAFEDLNSEDGDKISNSSVFFGSKIATRDNVSNFYNYHFFKYVYDRTPEYHNGQNKRIEFTQGTDGIATSISFDRIEKAIFSDDVSKFYNKRRHRGIDHKILPCRVKQKPDGTYGFYSLLDQKDSIDEILNEYIIESYLYSFDIGKFLNHYIKIPIAFVYCNSSNQNTCYVVHNGMSTARAFHHHDDSKLSENPIHEATTDLDIRCKIPFSAEFLAVFGNGHFNQEPLSPEDKFYQEQSNKQKTELELENYPFISSAESIYAYRYSYSSSRVICSVGCPQSCSFIPLIPAVFNKISSIQEFEFVGNFAHILSLSLMKIERITLRFFATIGMVVDAALFLLALSNPASLALYLGKKILTEYIVPKVMKSILIEYSTNPIKAKKAQLAINTFVSLVSSGYNLYKNWNSLSNLFKGIAAFEAVVTAWTAYKNFQLLSEEERENDKRDKEEMARKRRERELAIKNKTLSELTLFDTKLLASELMRISSLEIQLIRQHESYSYIGNSYEYLSQSLDTTRTLAL